MIKLDDWVLDAMKKGEDIEVIAYFGKKVRGILTGIDMRDEADLPFRVQLPGGEHDWCQYIEPYKASEKKYVPWTAENCPLVFGSELICKENRNIHVFVLACAFISYDDFNVRLYDNWYSFRELFDKFKMPDGSPCGIEVNE